jgi:hypothetical protein
MSFMPRNSGKDKQFIKWIVKNKEDYYAQR